MLLNKGWNITPRHGWLMLALTLLSGVVDQIRRWMAFPNPLIPLTHWLANRHTKPYQLVHHLHASQ